jgi:ADP-ribose pyrophosphatase YjhB (NUDIX family)
MLKIKPPNYKFCPFCGTRLKVKLEEGKHRKYCPKDNWKYYPYVGSSSAILIKKGDKILMVRRAREPYKNTWMFPAGFTDFGEHPEDTAKREVFEETGLKAKSLKLLNIFQAEDDPRLPGHFCFFYEAEVVGKINNLDKHENRGIGWFDINNPPKIGWMAHKEILKRLQKDT